MIIYLTRLFIIISIILGIPRLSLPSLAGNLFEIRGISIDAQGKSAIKARSKARSMGQIEAFDILLKRLTYHEDWSLLPDIKSLNVEEFVRVFRVEDEKISSNRYIAIFSVEFDSNAVLDMLRDANIPFIETQAQPALILPILEERTGYKLWEDNWWINSWRQLDLENLAFPMIVAPSDAENRAILSVEDALLGDTESMSALVRRYRVNTVIVAHATIHNDDQLDVVVYQYSQGGNRLFVRSFKNSNDFLTLANQATKSILNAFATEWKQSTVALSKQKAQLTVVADYNKMDHWMSMIERLQTVSFVKDVDIHVMTSQGAIMSLVYTGSVDQLVTHFAQNNMLLKKHKTEGWHLKIKR